MRRALAIQKFVNVPFFIVFDPKRIVNFFRECSKRIYDIPQFIFYALGYANKRVLAGTRSGIKVFLLKKEQSQQITSVQYFGMEAFG